MKTSNQSSESVADTSRPSATEIVWQWVSYGLWEWLLITLIALVAITLTYFFNNSGYDAATAAPYTLAGLVCLLPLAFIVNRVFAKTEPAKKEGFAGVVMVINGVIVLLAAIAGLVVAAVSALSEVFNGVSVAANIKIATALIAAALGLMLFIRIMRPARLAKFAGAFPYVVSAATILVVVLVTAGPFAYGVKTQQDRLIDSNLPTLDQDIQNYASNNNKLPSNLQAINFDNEDDTGPQSGQALVQKDLVTYKFDRSSSLYQLCVTYRQAKKSSLPSQSDSTSISTSSHSAGLVCYHQSASNDITTDDSNAGTSK